MADATYQPKVYRKSGGDEEIVASGGTLTVESGGTLDVSAGTLTLAAGQIASAALAASAVTNAKIADATIHGAKLDPAALAVYLVDGQNESTPAITVTGLAVGDRILFVKVYTTKASIASQAVRAAADFTVSLNTATVVANAANNSGNQYEFWVLKA